MNGTVLYEHPHKGDLWRMEITEHHGRTFFNCRKWFVKDGELHPTRQGFTMSLEGFDGLRAALAAYRVQEATDGPHKRS